jgi:hypothetical protein
MVIKHCSEVTQETSKKSNETLARTVGTMPRFEIGSLEFCFIYFLGSMGKIW